MKQQEVADAIQVSVISVSNMERGFPSVSDDMYMNYAQLMGKGADLFGIEEEMKKKKQLIMAELRHVEDIITGNPEEALDLLKDLHDTCLFHEAEVFATFLKGKISFVLQKWEDARLELSSSLVDLESSSFENSNLHSICLNDLGRLAYYKGDYQAAFDFTEKAILSFRDDPSGERLYYKPYLYLNKVIYLEDLKRYEEARRVLELMYENIESFKSNLTVVIQIYEQFAILLLKSGSPLKAEEYAKKGLNIAWENRQYRRLFSIWFLMGNIHVALEQKEEAETRYRKALAFKKYVSDNPERIGRAHLNYGKLLISLERAVEAEEELSNAVKIFQTVESKDKSDYVDSLISLGKLKKSDDLFQIADEIILSLNDNNAVSVDNLIKLCDFYESRNEEKFKHYHFSLYHKLKEDVSQ